MAEKGRWPDAPGDSAWNFLLPFSEWEAWINTSAVWFNDFLLCTVWSNPNVLLLTFYLSSFPLNTLFSRWLSRLSLFWQLFLSSHLKFSFKDCLLFLLWQFQCGYNISRSCRSADSASLFQHLQQVSIPSSCPHLLTFLSNPLSSISAPCWSIDWYGVGFVQP